MYTINVTSMSIKDAPQQTLAEWIPTFVPPGDLPVDGVWALDAEFCKFATGEGPTEPALFVLLPHLDERQLRAVASTAMSVINVQSGDLLHCETYCTFGNQILELRVPGALGKWNPKCPGDNVFQLVLISDEHIVIARHEMDELELDSLLDGMQGQHDSSGPNYNPVRVWGDARLDEVAHLGSFRQTEENVLYACYAVAPRSPWAC